MMKKLKVVVIGCGGRGIAYSAAMKNYIDKFEIVAIAEPSDSRRNHVKKLWNIPEEMCFTDYKPLLALGKIADIAVIATMDRDHFEPAMTAIDLKYDLLLEKPITPTAEECVRLTENAVKNNVRVIICTVLRYTDLFVNIKNIIDSGRLGKIMSINHEECVEIIHQSHSFVRGNWGNSARSSTMLLQKSCHDIDLIQWLLGKKCKKIQSFGHLSYFKRENAPEGSPERCIDGCPVQDTCIFNAMNLYYRSKSNWFRGAATKIVEPNDEAVLKAMKDTQYGKCVYKCDNDVVDHQTVNMLFEDDVTVTFSMNAFNRGGRFINIMGTKGELKAALDGDTPICIYEFEGKKEEFIEYCGKDGVEGGHGGGDEGIVNALYDYITGIYKGKSVPTIEESCYNHLIVFAAEESRLTGTVVDVDEFISKIK